MLLKLSIFLGSVGLHTCLATTAYGVDKQAPGDRPGPATPVHWYPQGSKPLSERIASRAIRLEKRGKRRPPERDREPMSPENLHPRRQSRPKRATTVNSVQAPTPNPVTANSGQFQYINNRYNRHDRSSSGTRHDQAFLERPRLGLSAGASLEFGYKSGTTGDSQTAHNQLSNYQSSIQGLYNTPSNNHPPYIQPSYNQPYDQPFYGQAPSNQFPNRQTPFNRPPLNPPARGVSDFQHGYDTPGSTGMRGHLANLLDAMRSTIAQYDSTRHDSSAFPDQTPEQFPGGVPGNFPGAQSGLSQPTGNSQNQRQSTSITPWSLLGAQAGSDQPAGSRTQPILQVVWADHSPDLLPLERYPDANEAKKIYQTLVSHLFDRFMPKFEGDRNKKSRVRHLQVVETGARDIPVLGTGFMVRVLFRNERNKVFPGQFPSQEAPGFLTDFPINVSDDFAWSPLHYRVVRTAPNHPQTNERPFLRDWLRTRLAAGVDEELSPSDVANSMGGILRTGNIFFTLGFRVYYTPEGLPAMPAQEMQVERSVREHFNVLNALAPSSELVLGQGYFQAHDMVQARANLIEA